jgi:hypothetical protein
VQGENPSPVPVHQVDCIWPDKCCVADAAVQWTFETPLRWTTERYINIRFVRCSHTSRRFRDWARACVRTTILCGSDRVGVCSPLTGRGRIRRCTGARNSKGVTLVTFPSVKYYLFFFFFCTRSSFFFFSSFTYNWLSLPRGRYDGIRVFL